VVGLANDVKTITVKKVHATMIDMSAKK